MYLISDPLTSVTSGARWGGGTEGKKDRGREGRRGARRRGGGTLDEPLATLLLPCRVIIVNLHNDNMRFLPSAPTHGQLCLGG